ncbi:MAG: divalent-cation tolerance protein CutA [Bryobacteraceae bacterium]
MTDKIVVYSTCASAEEAERIARRLVEERLAACVNVLPGMVSYYRWQGAIEQSSEWLLLIKTSRDRVDEVRRSIESLHSYQVPEVIAVPIVEGSVNYMNWLDAELKSS